MTPRGSFQGSKRRHLGDQGTSDVDAELVDDVAGILGRQSHVLRSQRVDGRGPDPRGREGVRARNVLAAVEDRRVVRADRREQEVEHGAIRLREIDMAPPRPVAAHVTCVRDHTGRLRIVDDDEVVVALERIRIQDLVALEDLLLLRDETGRIALEAVVDRLRDVEELVPALDDPPFDVEPRVSHEWHERVKNLGHASAKRGR